MEQLVVEPRTRTMPTYVVVVFWLAAVVVAFILDPYVERFILNGHIFPKTTTIALILRAPGVFWTTSVIAAVLSVFHPWKWRAGGLLCLSGAMSGLLYVLGKWSVGRYRPPMPGDETIPPHTPYQFQLFRGGIVALWKSPIAMGFPSGHTALAFATAHALAICLPKFRWLFYAAAAVVGLEAVWEFRHYLSDVVAGAGLGILAVHLTLAIVRLMMPGADAKKET